MNVLIRNLIKHKNISVRALTSDSKATTANAEKWDLYAGVSLERLRIISRDLFENEIKFSQFLTQVENENSYKSKFEIKLEIDLKRIKKIKEGDIENLDKESQLQTAQDFLDNSTKELEAFKFGSRKLDDKEEANVKSTKRSLDRRLLLLIQEKIGEDEFWLCPHGIYQGEESLRQTAERVLRDKCGNKLNVRFLGHCPCGFYKYKYPKHVRNNSVGAKIFFFKAQLLGGQVDDQVCKKFQWATRNELKILPKKYYKTITNFLVDEDH